MAARRKEIYIGRDEEDGTVAMSRGRNQHYVPRLLQRGFMHDHGKAEKTWFHQRGAKAELRRIKKIGVKPWFYSRSSVDGQLTLDDLIQKLESDLGGTVGRMRGARPGAFVDPGTAAHCVVHLVMRTDHIRRLVSEGVASLLNEAQPLFIDPARLAKMFGLNAPGLSQSVTDIIRNSTIEPALRGFPPPLAEQIMTVLIRENGEDLVRCAASDVAPLFLLILDDLAGMVRNAHNEVLGTSLRNNNWVTRLSTFSWTIEAGKELILPDAVALAVEADGRLVPLVFTNKEAVEAVVMPISSNLILVGISPWRDAVDLAKFNTQAAAACGAFFIGARAFDEENLAELIGTVPAAAIRSAVQKAVSSTEIGGEITPPVHAPSQEAALGYKGFSYTVRLADFGDAVLAKEISDVIESVVGELARQLPLHDLDGFTIALDYQRALAELDRGDATLAPANSSALEYGIGVAIPITVERNGAHKEHIVLSAEISQSWLSGDIKAQTAALNILIKMLASVAHCTRFAKDVATTFTPDPLTAELHPAVAATPSRWFTARESAFVAPHLGGFYADLVMESIEFTEREVAKERANISETDDTINVTRRALECVSAILEHAADWLGHRAGLADGRAFEGDDLPVRLRSRRLDRWIELFGRDLASVYEDEKVGLNMPVVTRLSQHVARLLWALGVFLWLDKEDVRCVVTDQELTASRTM